MCDDSLYDILVFAGCQCAGDWLLTCAGVPRSRPHTATGHQVVHTPDTQIKWDSGVMRKSLVTNVLHLTHNGQCSLCLPPQGRPPDSAPVVTSPPPPVAWPVLILSLRELGKNNSRTSAGSIAILVH